MAQSFQTPVKAAKGLGSAKDGVHHWIAQRVTALALVVLVPWFFIAMAVAQISGYDAARAWVGKPYNAVLMLLLLTAAFYHMRLGLQVVIEDYITKSGTRIALLVLNVFVVTALWVTATFAVLRIALTA